MFFLRVCWMFYEGVSDLYGGVLTLLIVFCVCLECDNDVMILDFVGPISSRITTFDA